MRNVGTQSSSRRIVLPPSSRHKKEYLYQCRVKSSVSSEKWPLFDVSGRRGQPRGMSAIVKVFRRRLTSDGGRRGAGRPAFENLQRTKPRVGRAEGRYLWGFGQRRWQWRRERNGN